jgi:hypothetical protein
MILEKLKSETKHVAHKFTVGELAVLHKDFHQSVRGQHVVESEFDSVKAQYKAKIEEAESKSEKLSALIDAGFEMQETKCVVVYEPKVRRKHYYLESELAEGWLDTEKVKPVHTEAMTNDDMQIELVEAESKFELKEAIELFKPVNKDSGILIVGRLGENWFAALRVAIGGRKLEERLDGEQPSCKKREDAVNKTVKRFSEWLVNAMGKEAAQGFEPELDKVIKAHKGREE